MDIKKMSVTELKALAYDELLKIDTSQKNLGAINAEITKKLNEQNKTVDSK
jgi:hypothetical protein